MEVIALKEDVVSDVEADLKEDVELVVQVVLDVEIVVDTEVQPLAVSNNVEDSAEAGEHQDLKHDPTETLNNKKRRLPSRLLNNKRKR